MAAHQLRDGGRPALVRWPDQAEEREQAAADGRPCLLLVADADHLPHVAGHEDWTWAWSDERDVAARLRDLVGRGAMAPIPRPPILDPVASREDDLRRVLERLWCGPGALVPWAGLAKDREDQQRLLSQVRAVVDPTGWWVEEIPDVGLVCGPGGDR